MSVFIRVDTNDYPFYEGDIRLVHPEIGKDFVCPSSFEEVHEVEIPTPNEYEKVVEVNPVNKDGVWYRSWEVVSFTEEEKLKKDTKPVFNPLFFYEWDSKDKVWVATENNA